MAVYVSVDAGGTKCSAIMFDGDFNLLGEGMSGGVNSSQGASPEHVRGNVRECLSELFGNYMPEQIETCYTVFVGNERILAEELDKKIRVLSYERLGEIEAGLYAGVLLEEGMLALSGTGSNVGYVGKGTPRKAGLGGWGPILGDQGSGAWIGQKALRAVVAAHDGWGPETLLYELINESWNLKRNWGMVNAVYHHAAPFRKVASIAPLVGEAARAGDAVALGILRGAGEYMALFAGTLLRRLGFENKYPPVVCCGGAWKAHASMFAAFNQKLSGEFAGITVEKPWFEHVTAGAAKELLSRGVGRAEGRRVLSERFADYVIKW